MPSIEQFQLALRDRRYDRENVTWVKCQLMSDAECFHEYCIMIANRNKPKIQKKKYKRRWLSEQERKPLITEKDLRSSGKL